jgi:hypothetical protein
VAAERTSAVGLLAVYRLETSEKEIHFAVLSVANVSSDKRHSVPRPFRQNSFYRSSQSFRGPSLCSDVSRSPNSKSLFHLALTYAILNGI